MLNLRKTNAPLNRYSSWKYILILVLVILGLIYALPNIFGESPALQITMKGGKQMPEVARNKIEKSLKDSKIPFNKIIKSKYHDEVIFKADSQVQLKAQALLQQSLGGDYIVALFLSPNTPKWLLALNAYPMKYGLDLRGGMYFLLDIDMQTVYDNALNGDVGQIRPLLMKNRIRYSGIQVKEDKGIVIHFKDAATRDKAKTLLRADNQFQSLIFKNQENLDSAHPTSPYVLTANFTADSKKQTQTFATQQVVEVMRHRVNELGVSEASVSQQGLDRVVIELPGVQNPARAKEIIAGTASLKLMLVNTKAQADIQSALQGNVPIGSKIYYTEQKQPYVLVNRPIITGNAIVGAVSTFDQQTNLPVVQVRLSGEQVSHFSKVTGENVGNPMAILLVQTTFTKKKVNGKVVTKTRTDSQIINVANILSQLGNEFVISGIGSMNRAQNLALRIRAGALPAPVQIVQDMQIGPSLGAENIKMGTMSVVVAMILIMLFMLVYYRLFGFIADIALVLNLIFIVAVMSIIPGATLSLPGIAGIVLNVAMAIDSNVLIFERIREELRNNNSPQNAINSGYERAFATIVDSNLTTLIVAVILFSLGSGPIKGFAVTLIIGIVSSMFTAITVTRAIVNWWYGKRTVTRLSIGI
jgi:preprotein translocase subunit SecD